MHKLENVASGCILSAITMLAIAAVNDKRLKEKNPAKDKEPFMTKGEQNTLLALAVVPAAVAFTLIAQKMETESIKS